MKRHIPKYIRYILLCFGIVCIFLILAYGILQLSKSRTFQFFGGLVSSVDTDKKIVALTFDDAPSPYSNEVVKILAKKNVKATFYVTGRNLEQFPQEGKNIVEAGNELGNHSYSHERFLFKSLSYIDTEIQKTNTLIRNSGYLVNITFRPPYGKKLLALPWYLKQYEMKTVMCDVEPDTYVAGNTEKIIQYTLEHTKPGSIILLHPFCEKECIADREALPKVIDGLLEQGYTFVTVSELLSLTN